MLDPAEIPLRDIHLPGTIGWWPIAPGWWFLAGGILGALLISVIGWWWWRRTRLRRRARLRLAEIVTAYATHQDRHRLAGDLSTLTRQIGLRLFGAPEIASLTGPEWLARLDTSTDHRFFSEGAGRILTAAPYDRTATTFDSSVLLAGFEHWLRRLPPAASSTHADV